MLYKYIFDQPLVLIGLIGFLMLLGYYLTLLGQACYRRCFSRYIEFEVYELNPMWQEDIKQGKLFNPKHLLMII